MKAKKGSQESPVSEADIQALVLKDRDGEGVYIKTAKGIEKRIIFQGELHVITPILQYAMDSAKRRLDEKNAVIALLKRQYLELSGTETREDMMDRHGRERESLKGG